MNRRNLLQAGIALSATGADASGAARLLDTQSSHQQAVRAGAGIAEVQTEAGVIAGYIRHDVLTFKGVPYAASTAGGGRFQPPTRMAPWRGVRSTRHLGPVAPQPSRSDGRHNDEEAFLFDWNDATHRVYAAGQGEDCLCLNVWTPALTGTRRPVMVWIHGGGWTNGSSGEQPAYDGESLARSGDVVVVSVNHRLGALGFLDLSSFGTEFEGTANLGLLDLVEALRWVRDNIASFGGDPDRVTIFGQSGGGAKVSMLTGMPAAKGLFHRAVIQSGSMREAQPQAKSRALAALVVKQAGLDRSSITQIRTMPVDALVRAAVDAVAGQDTSPAQGRLDFGPVLDGDVIPQHPFSPTASSLSSKVPIMVGSTLNEFAHGINKPEALRMTEQDLIQIASKRFGGAAPEILTEAAKLLPATSPFERWTVIETIQSRVGAIRQCRAKAQAAGSPAYLYWFTWRTPMLDDRPGAFHCAEIPFVFNNTDRCDTMTGGGARARLLGKRMMDCWVAFARQGDPNNASVPRWRPYDERSGMTMIFGDECEARSAPDRSLITAVLKAG